MGIEFRKFVPDENHATFRDSLSLMEANFADPSARTASFLKWLYLDNPYGKAVGYVAYEQDQPASQLFITFQNARLRGEDHRIGIVSNGCTMPRFRKRGLFNSLFTMLVEDCRHMGLPFIWAYPNPASQYFFLKTGFTIRDDVRLEVIPTNYLGLVKEARHKERFRIQGATEEVPLDLDRLERFTLLRGLPDGASSGRDPQDDVWRTPVDQQQFRWRFASHPTRSYHLLQHSTSGEWVIARFIKLFGLKSGVLLKTSCTGRAAFNALLSDLKLEFRDRINSFTTLESRDISRPALDPFHGRFAVPRWISPRRFPLTVYPFDASLVRRESRFIFQLGDYEVL